ncbi:MAG: hypothetical protein ACJAYC_000668 [Halieaceae bacterium]|jgi:hypothetical protein
MFGQVALRLLTMMGHSDMVPGAILAEDVQVVLDRLESAIAAETSPTEPELSED